MHCEGGNVIELMLQTMKLHGKCVNLLYRKMVFENIIGATLALNMVEWKWEDGVVNPIKCRGENI